MVICSLLIICFAALPFHTTKALAFNRVRQDPFSHSSFLVAGGFLGLRASLSLSSSWRHRYGFPGERRGWSLSHSLPPGVTAMGLQESRGGGARETR